MDLMKIGLYGLAGFGAYAAYEHFTKDKTPATTTTGEPDATSTDETASFTGTNWQRKGYGGTDWQNKNLNFTGTNWQNSGRNRETMWQTGGVFSNAAGKYRNSMSRMDDNDPHWYSYARDGRRVSIPVHPPLYMVRNNDYRPTSQGGRGRYMNQAGNLQGTDWQTTNMSNACGSCAG